MSLFKYLFLLALLFLPAACGFKPLYTAPKAGIDGESASKIVPFNQIGIANIPERSGQYLRNQLVDTIYNDGYPLSPRYMLYIDDLHETVTELGIRKDASATRAQMRIDAEMELVDRQTDVIVLRRPLVSTNSFNILDSQYTTNISSEYARERSLDDMARQVVTEIALYFNRGPDVPAPLHPNSVHTAAP